jgi:hypothetical protein
METQGPETHCRDERSTTPLGRTKFSESPSREETEKVSAFPFVVIAAAVIIIVFKYQLRKLFLRVGLPFGLYIPQPVKLWLLTMDAQLQYQGSPCRIYDEKSGIKAGLF